MTARAETFTTKGGFMRSSLIALAGAMLFAPPAAAEEAGEDSSWTPEIVVTGTAYRDLETQSATKTDTPILEVPQSVQVVTDRLIEDVRPRSLTEALINVSGVSDGGGRRAFDFPLIRGFDASADVFLDGLRVERGATNFPHEIYGLERIEVLKGPSGLLFGQGALGGVINQISRRPSSERSFVYVEGAGGSYDFWQGRIDANVPLGGGLAARLNAVYRSSEDFVDLLGKERVYVAPSLGWADGDTAITLLGSYTKDEQDGSYIGLPPQGTVLPNANGPIPRNRNVREPGWDELDIERWQIGYAASHRLSEAVTVRQNLRYSESDVLSSLTVALALLPDQRTLVRGIGEFLNTDNTLAVDTQFEAKFATGAAAHTLLAGVDFYSQDVTQSFAFGLQSTLDLYTPVYGQAFGPLFPRGNDFDRDDDLLGFYLQDQIEIGRLSLLVGGRYDRNRTRLDDRVNASRSSQTTEAFVPRAGLVYKISDEASVYGSWARSFSPNFGVAVNGDTFDPERGESFEAGVKTALIGDRLTSTVSIYQITRRNVLTDDPDPMNVGFQVVTGEQRSRGFEADVSLRITDGWNLTAAYAHTDIRITEDTSFDGDRPINVPRDQASLFTKYDAKSGRLAGLGIGGGVRYVGEREATLPNSYTLPDYVLVDAVLSYRTGPVKAQLNLYNLFDKAYFPSSASTGGIGVLVGQPRTATLTLGIGF